MLGKTFDKLSKAENKTNILRSSDNRYKILFEQVNAAAFLTTLDGKILEANLKSCDLLGYTMDELVQLSLKDIISSETNHGSSNVAVTSQRSL